MASYNIKSAYNNGWNPSWFGCSKFGSELVGNIEDFQKKHGLKPDGFCGPKTYQIARKQRRAERGIICGLQHIPIDHPVILWNQVERYKANKGTYREQYNERKVTLFVNHWDVCKKSSDTIKILNNRNLSCQFLIDSDPAATIIQTMNANHVAFHAGGRSWNNASIGVEICNPFYIKYQDKRRPRRIVKGAKVHGNTMRDHLDFYPQQIKALVKLWKAIHKAYNIPFQTPTKEDGSELGGVHRDSMNLKYSGYVHHYNLTSGKIDCGGLDLTRLINKITGT
tara:strand:- start:497 stop:1339 length:843 start_codon:yes stop_codon:yes gene_type:complete